MYTVLTNDTLATLNQIVEAARTKGIATVPVRVSVLAALLDRHGEEVEEVAAAPDLLAVAKECVELAKVAEGLCSCRGDDDFVWGVQERLNAAVAKAVQS